MSGELAAALYAATQTPLDAPLQIIAADARLRDALITKVPLWEDRGWIGIANAPLWQQLVNRLRQRIAVTTIKPAHEEHEKALIKKAKERAQQALLLNNVTTLAEQPSGPFTVSGVKLAALTQSLAYKGIRAKKDAPIRRGRDRNLRDIQEHFKTTYNTRLSEQDIWKGVRHVDIRNQIKDFLWKTLHNAHRCGSFWLNIPGYEERARCSWCGQTESIEHILTECTAPGQMTIWNMTRSLWENKGLRWQSPSTSEILGLGCRKWSYNDKKQNHGATRLWRILISESAFLIWKLRCERVIGHEEEERWAHSSNELRSRWASTMNQRLHLDAATTHPRFGRKALRRDIYADTWHDAVVDNRALYTHRSREGVLVGIPSAGYELDPG
ncbi:uncharacterized protein C8Q71DRAFT_823758 [Rhodofomes roseus]|uniref:Reverse transcriptase zinc-binding domain-containing protein n=1 Tax=Rhodofomes roseus TaxID=34475 RepID=A0ABQ8K8E8_9APHY|nr:uncharacterized protein C8Q71DRAFT_823758 [Rhodofomes roseus]KAH9833541.1 hypothetical protein C8Q71DRAFT_823758 [Rhodofomes roseus]